MNKIVLIFLSITTVLLSACINVDYVGQRLTALPEGTMVKFFSEQQEYNQDEYQLLGRVEVNAPDGTDILTIKERLQELAQENGASAVKFISLRREAVGVRYITSSSDDELRGSNSGQSRAVGGDPIYTNSFGQTGKLTSVAEPEYDVIIQAVLLADKGVFDEAMKQRKTQQQVVVE